MAGGPGRGTLQTRRKRLQGTVESPPSAEGVPTSDDVQERSDDPARSVYI